MSKCNGSCGKEAIETVKIGGTEYQLCAECKELFIRGKRAATENVIGRLENLYEKLKYEDHDQMTANGVDRAITEVRKMMEGESEKI